MHFNVVLSRGTTYPNNGTSKTTPCNFELVRLGFVQHMGKQAWHVALRTD